MKKTVLLFVACILSTLTANAQGLRGMMSKAQSLSKPTVSAPGSDINAALARGNDLLGYVTAATDQGVKAVQELIELYPPEKVQAIREAAAKYAEMRTKNPNQNLDSESLKVASDVADEASKLANDWQGYHKENVQAVRRADARLSLVLLADTQAGEKAPAALTDVQKASQALGSNPMQTANASQLLSLTAVLMDVCKDTPQQIRSFTIVRGVARKIAEAENVKLANDPSPASIHDSASLTTSVRELP